MQRRFQGKTVIITGGASGIGAALARRLASEGARLVLADRQADLADRVAGEIGKTGAEVRGAELDVRDPDAVEALVKATVARENKVDLFFNNAGIAVGGEMDNYARKDWDDVIDVNLRGVAYGIQAVYPQMIRQGFGHIVNTASMAGLAATGGGGSYVATKYAVVGLSKSLRVEAKKHGVKVSVLCPGAIATPILTGGRFGRHNFANVSKQDMLAMWAITRPMDPARFAAKAIDAIVENRAVIVVPSWWKAAWYLERFAPDLGEKVWGLVLNRIRRQIEEAGGRPSTLEEERATPE
jgi:NAD(P)-dependent dehydrogenase (short-subunit alcohol dehydrogenase family)